MLTSRAVNPNGPVVVCPSPRVTCDDECCPTNYICSASAVCVPKPAPPPPGTVTISWYTDRYLGTPNLISVHGRGFAAGAAVSFLERWVTYGKNGSPEYHEMGVWGRNFSDVADFDFATGMQDCSRAGSPGGGTYGEPAVVSFLDWALLKTTEEIWVRTQRGGLCTAASQA